jgi:hypothetical protein
MPHARDQDKIVNQRGGSDLLVERILGMRHSQTAPNLGHIGVKSKNAVAEVGEQRVEPALKHLRLLYAREPAVQLRQRGVFGLVRLNEKLALALSRAEPAPCNPTRLRNGEA